METVSDVIAQLQDMNPSLVVSTGTHCLTCGCDLQRYGSVVSRVIERCTVCAYYASSAGMAQAGTHPLDRWEGKG